MERKEALEIVLDITRYYAGLPCPAYDEVNGTPWSEERAEEALAVLTADPARPEWADEIIYIEARDNKMSRAHWSDLRAVDTQHPVCIYRFDGVVEPEVKDES